MFQIVSATHMNPDGTNALNLFCNIFIIRFICEIGTPYFQDKYFPGGTIPDADGLLKLLDDGGFEWLYMNLPDRNPDYLPQAAQLWVGPMAATLEDCVKRGELEPVLNQNGSVLFRRTKPSPAPSVVIRR